LLKLGTKASRKRMHRTTVAAKSIGQCLNLGCLRAQQWIAELQELAKGRHAVAREFNRVFAQPFDDNDNDVAAPGEWLEPVRSECGTHSMPVAAGTALRSPRHGAARNNECLGDLGNSPLLVRRSAPNL
jgi:hypothetical protein